MRTKIKQGIIVIALLLTGNAAYGVKYETVDSLLKAYDADVKEITTTDIINRARTLVSLFTKEGVFLSTPPRVGQRQVRDTIDLYVWYGAVRFCKENAYYAEGLKYAKRALPLAKEGKHNDILVTMLCDKGYMQLKQGQMANAIETEMEAARLAKETHNDLQLSRAYLYISIANNMSRELEQAEKFVRKAIEVDRRMGGGNNSSS